MQNILFLLKKYIRDVILYILLIICIILLVYKNDNKEVIESNLANNILKEETITEENEIIEEKKKYINIDIKGAVKKPGVYNIEEGLIINDVIKLAGGFKSDAYQKGINLSKKLSDEMVIYIYTKTEINQKNASEEEKIANNEGSCQTPTYSICECLENQESIIEPGNDTNGNENKLVNINTALLNELTSISGIGSSKAESIIKYREENGNFKSIEEIKNVSGIGDALFAKIKDYITI